MELDQIYLEAVREIGRIRSSHADLGHHISLPRLPNVLSESIAADMAAEVFGTGTEPSRPADLGDLEVLTTSTVRRGVAVKGTGKTKWITITKTDLAADCLVWIDYSKRLTTGIRELDVWFFNRRVRDWAGQRKMTMRQAIAQYGEPEHYLYVL